MSVGLSTRYLGLALKHPIVASASPLTGRVDSLKRLQAAGVAAVVLPSLFEEQIEHGMSASRWRSRWRRSSARWPTWRSG